MNFALPTIGIYQQSQRSMYLTLDVNATASANELHVATTTASPLAIVWGDGTITHTPQPTDITSHVYDIPGEYTCTVIHAPGGVINWTSFINVAGDALRGVKQWGGINFGSVAFYISHNGTTYTSPNLISVPAVAPPGITSLYRTFQDCISFNDPNVGSWVTAAVTNMTQTFYGSGYNQPLDRLDVSNVKTFRLCFASSKFAQSIETWDFSSAEDLSGFAQGTTAFQSKFSGNFPECITMAQMFADSRYNQPIDWITPKLENIGQMLASSRFNSPFNLDTTNVTYMTGLCASNSVFNQPLNFVTRNVQYMDQMFLNCTSLNQDYSHWCVPLIPNKPTEFDTNTPVWLKENRQPKWGTCPEDVIATEIQGYAASVDLMYGDKLLTNSLQKMTEDEIVLKSPYQFNKSSYGVTPTLFMLYNVDNDGIPLPEAQQGTWSIDEDSDGILMDWEDVQDMADYIPFETIPGCSILQINYRGSYTVVPSNGEPKTIVLEKEPVDIAINFTTARPGSNIFGSDEWYDETTTDPLKLKMRPWTIENATVTGSTTDFNATVSFADTPAFQIINDPAIEGRATAWIILIGTITCTNELYEFSPDNGQTWIASGQPMPFYVQVGEAQLKVTNGVQDYFNWTGSATNVVESDVIMMGITQIGMNAVAPIMRFKTTASRPGMPVLMNPQDDQYWENGTHNFELELVDDTPELITPLLFKVESPAEGGTVGIFGSMERTIVDWGDGHYTLPGTSTTNILEHTYSGPGTYTLRVSDSRVGQIGVSFGRLAIWSPLITEFISFGGVKYQAVQFSNDSHRSARDPLKACTNLVKVPAELPPHIRQTLGMFYGCTSFNDPQIVGWDVSNVTNMNDMFYSATGFNQDLSSWCVTKIASKPAGFDTNTPAWVKENRQPVWGTCPDPDSDGHDIQLYAPSENLTRLGNAILTHTPTVVTSVGESIDILSLDQFSNEWNSLAPVLIEIHDVDANGVPLPVSLQSTWTTENDNLMIIGWDQLEGMQESLPFTVVPGSTLFSVTHMGTFTTTSSKGVVKTITMKKDPVDISIALFQLRSGTFITNMYGPQWSDESSNPAMLKVVDPQTYSTLSGSTSDFVCEQNLNFDTIRVQVPENFNGTASADILAIGTIRVSHPLIQILDKRTDQWLPSDSEIPFYCTLGTASMTVNNGVVDALVWESLTPSASITKSMMIIGMVPPTGTNEASIPMVRYVSDDTTPRGGLPVLYNPQAWVDWTGDTYTMTLEATTERVEPAWESPVELNVTPTVDGEVVVHYPGAGHTLVIDWGDGVIEGIDVDDTTTNVRTHTYVGNEGMEYKLKISKRTMWEGIKPSGTLCVHSPLITDITSFGGHWTGIRFNHPDMNGDPATACTNLTSVPINLPSHITDTSYTFAGCTNFNEVNLKNWDVSNVTNMTGMFKSAINFNQDLQRWCVTKIPTAPVDFDTNTPAWEKENRQPIWGTCQFG